uniref:uncharacterized protein LOC118542830 isoform X2 n=1 Tax=Halichoerus grypus TaxID=9711 RepID=UPI001659BDCA|nr:uncharacterized protein LOC118542830 isoform X2 [Halichoerus grypus]XP_035959243.1 uncharacterized protein LOC118542830 isoform X3 [Halichoerus grypus]
MACVRGGSSAGGLAESRARPPPMLLAAALPSSSRNLARDFGRPRSPAPTPPFLRTQPPGHRAWLDWRRPGRGAGASLPARGDLESSRIPEARFSTQWGWKRREDEETEAQREQMKCPSSQRIIRGPEATRQKSNNLPLHVGCMADYTRSLTRTAVCRIIRPVPSCATTEQHTDQNIYLELWIPKKKGLIPQLVSGSIDA